MNDNRYIIYIDESGIHKSTDYSSFVLVYIHIKDNEYVNTKIEKIEKDLGISNFHWADFGSKIGWKIRKNFIINSCKLPFSFKYSIIKNPVNHKKELHDSILLFLVEKNTEKIFIDGKQPKWYEKQFKKSLRDRGISLKSLKTIRDESIPAIRLADALAGLIRTHYDNPRDLSRELYEYIKRKRNHPPSD